MSSISKKSNSENLLDQSKQKEFRRKMRKYLKSKLGNDPIKIRECFMISGGEHAMTLLSNFDTIETMKSVNT